MKKILYMSGIVTILLLPLLLSGWADTDDTVKESLRQGNRRYESADYAEALKLYETGLAASPENKTLNFNAAQAAYILGEYEKAIEYYEKAGDNTDKFLNAGNICFRTGDTVQDINQKAQYYSQALQIYMEGITKFPQDVPLKYNYELVKEKLEELLPDMEQENNEQGEGGEESQEQENTENAGGDQGQESENAEASQENQEQDSDQDENSNDEQSQSQEGDDGQQGSYAQNDGEEAPDQETIERILQMLEAQEEESLKNNQEVVGGNEGKNGW